MPIPNQVYSLWATRRLRECVSLLLVGASLVACGGGAQTTDNPLSQDSGGDVNDVYTGEVARDADVLHLACHSLPCLILPSRSG